jgi:small subunit ribosomal protein S1
LAPDDLPEAPELPERLHPQGPPLDQGAAKRFPPPSRRDRLSADLEQEFQQALGDAPVEDLMAGDEATAPQAVLEPQSRLTGRVVAIRRDDVFVEMGGREQGVLPLAQFAQAPEPGAAIDVVVARFHAEDGLYELTLPHASAAVEDWSDLREGIVVEARVTGHNAGGLECEVNHIRGFIPVSQIALYRIENLEEFVGQKFPCVVTEANAQRRNLVLSRRAVLEREREEARRTLLESLAPGQIREGVVRKLMDFGAFVDLGSGVDGLLHVSQMSWARISHPREMFQEGQTIQVRIEKVDAASGRISLTYREMLENPWTNIERKYLPRTAVRGKVTRLMEFGAFVELEPGVEGLVHISELSRKHVRRVSDVVEEGQEVEVMVLAVDPQAKRISLSMKDLLPPEPEPAQAPEQATSEPEPSAKPPKGSKKPGASRPLLGGLGRPKDGVRFGLKW